VPPLLVLPFPAIDPVIVEVGPFALRWYALAYIVGIVLAWRYMRALVLNSRLWGRSRASHPGRYRRLRALGHPRHHPGRPARIRAVLQSRLLSRQSGGDSRDLDRWHVVSRRLCGYGDCHDPVCLEARLSLWTLFDLAGCAAPDRHVLRPDRELHQFRALGPARRCPWAVIFPTGGPEPRHPSQLYEAALEGVDSVPRPPPAQPSLQIAAAQASSPALSPAATASDARSPSSTGSRTPISDIRRLSDHGNPACRCR
jgi:phosphatidylglycerol:prolipoprotein diacylglycerol transferase